ncbi:MAG: RecX family transcriptional regulator [Sphingobium sp.]|nr:RecX family transcriptional regulator [Sphingobium sp.]
MADREPRQRRPAPPLDQAKLDELALAYAARFATSRAKLTSYLNRKLRERGWSGERAADVDALVQRLSDLRYVDDSAYAGMKAGSLTRRGYGVRRVEQSLRAAGIEAPEREDARESAHAQRWASARAFATKRRIGPFASDRAEPALREKQIAAFLRAGHDFSTARAWVHAEPGEEPETPD